MCNFDCAFWISNSISVLSAIGIGYWAWRSAKSTDVKSQYTRFYTSVKVLRQATKSFSQTVNDLRNTPESPILRNAFMCQKTQLIRIWDRVLTDGETSSGVDTKWILGIKKYSAGDVYLQKCFSNFEVLEAYLSAFEMLKLLSYNSSVEQV